MSTTRKMCDRCFTFQTRLKRHKKTCKGSATENYLSGASGQKKRRGTTRAAERGRLSTAKFPELVRCNLSVGPCQLTRKMLLVTPAEIRPHPKAGEALGGPATHADPTNAICTAIKSIVGDLAGTTKMRFKTHETGYDKEEVHSSEWSSGGDVKSMTVRAFLEKFGGKASKKGKLCEPLPHIYAFCELLGSKEAFERAKSFAPIPKVYDKGDVMVGDRVTLILSAGGVCLKAHTDPSGGLLVLAEGHHARGRVAFGNRHAFESQFNPFDFSPSRDEQDEKGCGWALGSVAELLCNGDAVHFPCRIPHAVRWGGIRLCVACFTKA